MVEADKDLVGWAYLKNAANEQEAVLVESILATEGIPVLCKHREAGSYLAIHMGMSAFGIDIYVPENTLDLAKGLMESELMDMPEETGKEEVIKAEARYQSRRRGIVWLILAYLLLPVAVIIIWNTFFNR